MIRPVAAAATVVADDPQSPQQSHRPPRSNSCHSSQDDGLTRTLSSQPFFIDGIGFSKIADRLRPPSSGRSAYRATGCDKLGLGDEDSPDCAKPDPLLQARRSATRPGRRKRRTGHRLEPRRACVIHRLSERGLVMPSSPRGSSERRSHTVTVGEPRYSDGGDQPALSGSGTAVRQGDRRRTSSSSELPFVPADADTGRRSSRARNDVNVITAALGRRGGIGRSGPPSSTSWSGNFGNRLHDAAEPGSARLLGSARVIVVLNLPNIAGMPFPRPVATGASGRRRSAPRCA